MIKKYCLIYQNWPVDILEVIAIGNKENMESRLEEILLKKWEKLPWLNDEDKYNWRKKYHIKQVRDS